MSRGLGERKVERERHRRESAKALPSLSSSSVRWCVVVYKIACLLSFHAAAAAMLFLGKGKRDF